MKRYLIFIFILFISSCISIPSPVDESRGILIIYESGNQDHQCDIEYKLKTDPNMKKSASFKKAKLHYFFNLPAGEYLLKGMQFKKKKDRTESNSFMDFIDSWNTTITLPYSFFNLPEFFEFTIDPRTALVMIINTNYFYAWFEKISGQGLQQIMESVEHDGILEKWGELTFKAYDPNYELTIQYKYFF